MGYAHCSHLVFEAAGISNQGPPWTMILAMKSRHGSACLERLFAFTCADKFRNLRRAELVRLKKIVLGIFSEIIPPCSWSIDQHHMSRSEERRVGKECR